MGGELVFSEWSGGILAAVLFAGLTLDLIRRRRCRKWAETLRISASEVSLLRQRKKRPAWVRSLPPDLDVSGGGSLFDALYAHFETRPEGLVPSALGLAISARPADSKNGILAVDRPPTPSDEDRIKSLLNAPTDASVAPPSDAFTQNLVMNLVNVLRGRKKLKQGIEHAVLDSLTPGGGFAGAKIGGAVGLALAPFVVGMATVFVPASVAAGAWLGAWTGKQMGSRFKARQYYSVLKRLRVVSRDFQRWFIERFPEFLRELDAEYEKAIEAARVRGRAHQSRFFRFWLPDLQTVFFRRSLAQLRQDRAADRKHFKSVFATVRRQDPLEFAAVLERMNAKTLEKHPEFTGFRRDYRTALHDFRELKKNSI